MKLPFLSRLARCWALALAGVLGASSAALAQAPANDNCSGAITLTPATTCTPVSGTTVGATQSQAAILCNGFTGSADDDVWYKFVATATSHTVTVASDNDFVVETLSGSCTAPASMSCSDAAVLNGTETIVMQGLTVGSTYLVRLYSYGDATTAGTFTICVTAPSGAPCAAVTNAAVTSAAGTATASTGTLTFTPASGATNYYLTLAPTAGGTTPVTATVTGSPVNITGLTPNTSYTVTITTNCSNGGVSSTVTVVFTSAAAPVVPANDDPAGAISLTPAATCTATNGTNAGATTTTVNGYANPGSCGIAASPKDVWYKFTTLAGQTAATVTVTGAPAGLVRVFSASSAAGPFTQVSCSAGATNNTVAPALTVPGLTPNTTYYVSVAGYGSADTQGAFTICVTTPAAATCAPVTAAAATSASGTPTASTAQVTFTAASGATNYYVTLTPTAGGTSTNTTATGSPVNLTGLTPSTSYTVTITTICSNGGVSSPVTVTFTSAAAPTAPANDDCAGAITLTPATTCTPVNGTTVAATQSLAAIVCAGYTGNADDDVWYKFVATATSHTVTVVGNTGFDAIVDVRSGTCANSTNIGCADATLSAGTETVQLTGLTVGSTYFVRVYSYGPATSAGTFTICVTAPSGAPCAAVTNAAVTSAAGTATASTGTLTFTPASGATNYYLTLAPTAGGTTPVTATVTGSPVNITGLTPNTSYTVTITTNCSNGGVSSTVTVVFTSAAAPAVPANDNPSGAVALTVSSTCTPTNGTTAGATTTTVNGYANPGTCGIAVNPTDVWYRFTTLAGQTTATVTVTGAPAGLVRVFSASSAAGPFTQVSCSAGATNNTVAPALSLTGLTPATTYYISVAGYGSADTQGTFTICVTGTGTAPACPAVTNLSAGTPTATGATLTFTAATGATNYTVTYTPNNGTAVTVTTTSSPVTLTGLTPGTTYAVSVVTNCSATSASTAATTSFTTLSPAPTNVAVAAGSITATTASVTFTAATGATSYTVTYTAAGGQPRTVTVTGSPANLTGLTANTNYTVTVVANYAGGGTSSPVSTTFTTQTLAVRTTLGGGELTVFPNPAHHDFTLSVPAVGARTAQLELVNALGQVVRRQSLSLTAGGTRVAVEATGLASGLYWVRVQAGGETAVTRISLE